jgi:hypothetical protein
MILTGLIVGVIPLMSHKHFYLQAALTRTSRQSLGPVKYGKFISEIRIIAHKITLVLFSGLKGLKCFFDKETNQQCYG